MPKRRRPQEPVVQRMAECALVSDGSSSFVTRSPMRTELEIILDLPRFAPSQADRAVEKFDHIQRTARVGVMRWRTRENRQGGRDAVLELVHVVHVTSGANLTEVLEIFDQEADGKKAKVEKEGKEEEISTLATLAYFGGKMGYSGMLGGPLVVFLCLWRLGVFQIGWIGWDGPRMRVRVGVYWEKLELSCGLDRGRKLIVEGCCAGLTLWHALDRGMPRDPLLRIAAGDRLNNVDRWLRRLWEEEEEEEEMGLEDSARKKGLDEDEVVVAANVLYGMEPPSVEPSALIGDAIAKFRQDAFSFQRQAVQWMSDREEHGLCWTASGEDREALWRRLPLERKDNGSFSMSAPSKKQASFSGGSSSMSAPSKKTESFSGGSSSMSAPSKKPESFSGGSSSMSAPSKKQASFSGGSSSMSAPSKKPASFSGGSSSFPSKTHTSSSSSSVEAERWYNVTTGEVSRAVDPCVRLHGGVLGDEMGLGKSAEVLALIATRRPPPEWYRHVGVSGMVRSRATLLCVQPDHVAQWMREVERWTTGLSVVVMSPLMGQSAEERNRVRQADILIASYPTLRMEQNYVPMEERGMAVTKPVRVTSAPVRARPPVSMLYTTEFWRVVLDEAQEVKHFEGEDTKEETEEDGVEDLIESPVMSVVQPIAGATLHGRSSLSKVAEMCARVNAERRWCVSGTPLGDETDSSGSKADVLNLHGLFAFLHYDPFELPHAWHRLAGPALASANPEAIYALMRPIWWRNSHAIPSVRAAMNLPPVSTFLSSIRQSRVEQAVTTSVEEAFIERWTEALRTHEPVAIDTLRRDISTLLERCAYPIRTRGAGAGARSQDETLALTHAVFVDKAHSAKLQAANYILFFAAVLVLRASRREPPLVVMPWGADEVNTWNEAIANAFDEYIPTNLAPPASSSPIIPTRSNPTLSQAREAFLAAFAATQGVRVDGNARLRKWKTTELYALRGLLELARLDYDIEESGPLFTHLQTRLQTISQRSDRSVLVETLRGRRQSALAVMAVGARKTHLVRALRMQEIAKDLVGSVGVVTSDDVLEVVKAWETTAKETGDERLEAAAKAAKEAEAEPDRAMQRALSLYGGSKEGLNAAFRRGGGLGEGLMRDGFPRCDASIWGWDRRTWTDRHLFDGDDKVAQEEALESGNAWVLRLSMLQEFGFPIGKGLGALVPEEAECLRRKFLKSTWYLLERERRISDESARLRPDASADAMEQDSWDFAVAGARGEGNSDLAVAARQRAGGLDLFVPFGTLTSAPGRPNSRWELRPEVLSGLGGLVQNDAWDRAEKVRRALTSVTGRWHQVWYFLDLERATNDALDVDGALPPDHPARALIDAEPADDSEAVVRAAVQIRTYLRRRVVDETRAAFAAVSDNDELELPPPEERLAQLSTAAPRAPLTPAGAKALLCRAWRRRLEAGQNPFDRCPICEAAIAEVVFQKKDEDTSIESLAESEEQFWEQCSAETRQVWDPESTSFPSSAAAAAAAAVEEDVDVMEEVPAWFRDKEGVVYPHRPWPWYFEHGHVVEMMARQHVSSVSALVTGVLEICNSLKASSLHADAKAAEQSRRDAAIAMSESLLRDQHRWARELANAGAELDEDADLETVHVLRQAMCGRVGVNEADRTDVQVVLDQVRHKLAVGRYQLQSAREMQTLLESARVGGDWGEGADERDETEGAVRQMPVCPITQEPIQSPGVTPCGHLFEYDRIILWASEASRCPTCNAVFSADEVSDPQQFATVGSEDRLLYLPAANFPSLTADQTAMASAPAIAQSSRERGGADRDFFQSNGAMVVGSESDEFRRARRELGITHATSAQATAGGRGLQGAASLSSKLQILAGRLRALPGDEKALVFTRFSDFVAGALESQFPDGNIAALPRNRSERSSILERFQSTDSNPQVLILDFRTNASGLTLTRASHVFFLDPAPPSTEAQAVARAHRIGQTRSVSLFRLACADTADMRVLAHRHDAEATNVVALQHHAPSKTPKKRRKRREDKEEEADPHTLFTPSPTRSSSTPATSSAPQQSTEQPSDPSQSTEADIRHALRIAGHNQ